MCLLNGRINILSVLNADNDASTVCGLRRSTFQNMSVKYNRVLLLINVGSFKF